MEKGSGTIERLNSSETRYGQKHSMCIDGSWFDYFTKFPLRVGTSEGAVIDFEYEPDDGRGYNPKIKKFTVSKPGTGPAPAASTAPAKPAANVGRGEATARDLHIMRQNAATNANALLGNNGGTYTVQELLETAEVLVGYYTGEVDVAKLTTMAETGPELTAAELADEGHGDVSEDMVAKVMAEVAAAKELDAGRLDGHNA